jgi:hypothetical protein
MHVGDLVWDVLFRGMAILTPTERWRAAGSGPRDSAAGQMADYLLPVLAAVVLVFLILALWWVMHRQRPARRKTAREAFAATALRRGLSARERQILVAIVARSGLGRSHDIFTTVDAFDRGATKLLAECGRTRRPHEIERLKTEVTGLRQKLGFQTLRAAAGLGQSRKVSSRDIPVGKPVEVLWQRQRGGMTLRGEVVRNDDIELAITLEKAVPSKAGDVWRVRYAYGAGLWEYDTAAVSCEEKRLTLNHVDQVRFVNRRRFTRVAVQMPAVVAAFPFMRRALDSVQRSSAMGDPSQAEAPVFVRGMVTQLAGPGLCVEAPLEVCAGDRVLVAFRPSEIAEQGNVVGANFENEYVIEDVGLVRHCRTVGGGVVIAMELVGLNETDIDALVRLTNAMIASAAEADADGQGEPSRESMYTPAIREI